MKECKYCKQPGEFDRLLGKVLCEEHRDIYRNLRSVWEAVAELQLGTRSR